MEQSGLSSRKQLVSQDLVKTDKAFDIKYQQFFLGSARTADPGRQQYLRYHFACD